MNLHHVEESQLDQMLGRHQERAHDHISFLVSPPCHATNFMRMEKFELASTADEAQGSTSRTGVGMWGGAGVIKTLVGSAPEISGCESVTEHGNQRSESPSPEVAHVGDGNGEWGIEADAPRRELKRGVTPRLSPASSDFSILHRPHIVRSKEEVHMIFCSGGCERVAHGKCDCGVPLCNNCRFLPNGDRSIFGDCKECSKVPQDSTELFSNGRQV